MKKIIILASICFIIFFISCEKVGKVCHVSDPLTELPWLAEQIVQMETNSESVEISKVVLKDIKTKKRIEGIGIYHIWDFSSHYGIQSYSNCSGEGICSIGGAAGNQCQDYEVIKEEIIYVTE